MAALLAGQSISQVSKDYNMPRGTVASIKARLDDSQKEALHTVAYTKKEQVGGLIIDYLVANLSALRAQAELFSDPEWLRKQHADSAAVLHGVMTDKAVRLIEALGQYGNAQVSDTDTEP